MIWTLKITCVSGPYHDAECVRYIEVDEEASLYDVHVAIQDAVHFDDEFEFAYFQGASPNGKRAYYPEGVNPDEGVDTDLYEDEELATALPSESRRHLYYLFNFDEEWIFEIRKERGEKEPDPNEFYPLVVEQASVGPDPMQYGNDLDDFADPDEAAEHRAAHPRRSAAGEEADDGDDDRRDIRSLFGIADGEDDEDEDEKEEDGFGFDRGEDDEGDRW
jgi:hypothetical protein